MAYYMTESPWITTFSGKHFHLLDPQPEEICVEDIAHSLSLLCRFNGHSKIFYCVGQHSVIVSKINKKLFPKEKLFHDATEAFCGDVCRPLKHCLPEYKIIEARIANAVSKKYNLQDTDECHEEVKSCDDIALVTESRDVMQEDFVLSGYYVGKTPLTIKIKPWTAKKSEREFLKRYSELC